MKVDFKFSSGENVKTRLGTIGIIEWSAIDESGIKQYSVKTANNNSWWKESDLESV
jgi:hypothetical protein